MSQGIQQPLFASATAQGQVSSLVIGRPFVLTDYSAITGPIDTSVDLIIAKERYLSPKINLPLNSNSFLYTMFLAPLFTPTETGR